MVVRPGDGSAESASCIETDERWPLSAGATHVVVLMLCDWGQTLLPISTAAFERVHDTANEQQQTERTGVSSAFSRGEGRSARSVAGGSAGAL